MWTRLSRTPWREIGYVRPRSWIGSLAIGIAFGIASKLLMKAIVMPLLSANPINQACHNLVGNRAALPAAVLTMIIVSEGNLEKIFRLIHALGRCYVFIDEADQSLGRGDASGGDSGISGRIYSMLAEEMGNSSNRGSVIWVLASSRPDLIEVDLKRPGRVDVKIPIFPTSTKRESFDLLCMLLKKRGIVPSAESFATLDPIMPLLLTPGAAEALAVKIYRQVRTSSQSLDQVLLASLREYQNPVPPDVMQFQIRLAAAESSDLDFVPALFRPTAKPAL